MPIHTALIGYGRIGREHARWIAASGDATPAVVFDPTPARRAIAQADGLPLADDLSAVLADESIDAVLVSTPTAMHFEHAARAIAAAKHVMVEKPVTLTHAQAVELAAAASSAGVVLSVFQNRRWDIDYLTALAAVKRHAFGKLINVESRIGQFGSCVGPAAPEYRPGWRNEAAFGGGGLYDWGSHLIDQLWRLMGPATPVRVFAQLRGNVWTGDCDDLARVVIDFSDGSVGLVEINTTTATPLPRWHIDGTLGSASSPHSPEYDTRVWADFRFRHAPAGKGGKFGPGDTAGSPLAHNDADISLPGAGAAVGAGASGHDAAVPLPIANPGLSEPEIWRCFAHAARGQSAPAVTIASVLPTMRLLDAARESSATGRAVDVSDVHYEP